MNIFIYLFSRDSFLNSYSKFLSKRLLNSTSISDDYED
jgi:hypothetical protein